MKPVLAIDLGGTKTAIGLVDSAGRITEKRKLAAATSFDATIAQLAAECPRGVSAGVIVPGIYDPSNGQAWAPNLWGRDFHPLRDALEQKLGASVSIGSDRTGCVLAEEWLGVARGFCHVIFIAVGTGIGVGILCDGRPVEGARGIAGAAGWMVVGGPWKAEYRACGGWETEAAGPAVARRAGMASAEEVVAAARASDARAIDALVVTAEYLALGIAGLIAMFNPEMVVLGGGFMAAAADLLLPPMRADALRWTQPVAATQTKIEVTALGPDAGLLGAARLAWLHTGD